MNLETAVMEDKVQTETYCRHGFHEWVEIEPEGFEQYADEAGKVWVCKHCAKYRNPA
ncbi:hypothetical protein [Agaribacterium sp. ZY112]|uniref:hypothetical protein n=1 Tax=Agaribacterium sp. ZY112 TaxID=3233574 RepID=UPI0035259E14